MRPPFRLIPFLLLAVSAIAVPALAAPTLVRTLPNKSTLILRENRTRPVVSIQAWIKSGSRDESRSERGAATVLQQVMLRASKKRVADEIEKDIALYGGSFGNDVGYDYSMFQITLPARYFKAGVDLLSEIVTQPRLDTRDIQQSIGIARDQAKSVLQQAEQATGNPVRDALWPDTPLGSPAIVPELELAAVTMPLVVRYYKTHYLSENLMLVVVGDVDPAEVPAVMEKAFASMPQGKAPSHPKVKVKGAPSTKISFVDPPPDAGAAFAIGFRGPAWGTADAVALDVLLAALVDSPHSRILTRPVEGGDAFVNLTAQRSFDVDGGTISLSGRIDPMRAKDAEAALIALLAQARTAPISQGEVDDAVDAVVSRDGFYAADMTGLARATALAYLRGKPGADEVYFDRLRTVRPEDLTGVAAQYLDLDHAAVVEMMPRAVADSLGVKSGFEGRIKEKLGINQAAYGKGPKVTQSTAQDRQKRIDAPLAKIPSAPPDMGRARVDKSTLAGGLRLLTSQDRSTPTVTVAVYLAGGTRYENDANNGVTSLLRESILTSSDPKADHGAAYRHSLPDLGRFQSYQDKDMWGFSVSVPSNEWKEAVTRLGTMLSHPEIDSVTVDATRLFVLDALNKWSDNDQVQRSWSIFPTKYQVSGYGLPALGTRYNLMTMPYGTLMDWYKTFVVRGNLVVTVFGDVTPSEVGPAVDHAFADVSSKPFQPPAVKKEPPFEGFREKWDLGSGTSCTVNLAFNGPPARSRDIPAFYVINSLLSGPRGWFEQYMNSNEALFKGSSSIVSQSIDESPLIASVVIAGPMVEEDGVKLLFRQFKKVAFYEMTAEEADTLRFAKINAAGTYLGLLGTNTSRAFQWGRAELFGLGMEYPLTLPVKIDAVTAEDVQAVGLAYFEKDQFNRRPYAITETRPGGW
jgi:zinc protease